ncbi:MAG TPA: hypothetical protein EYG91_07145 [Aquifex aeolicus]|nr:hypothetical protein [Aquifex aeolicus]
MSSVRFRLAFILLLLFFSFSSVLYSNTLEICHKAYYVFFSVAYHCNRYEVSEKELNIIGYSTTTGLGSILGKIEIKGKTRGNLHQMEKPIDPFMAGLIVYIISSVREKELRFFYDGRVQKVRYKVLSEEILEWKGKNGIPTKFLWFLKLKPQAFLLQGVNGTFG